MKQQPLLHHLKLMQSAQDKDDWIKARYHGENALKKISSLSYSPYEEYLLMCMLGYAYYELAEYSRSLNLYYKAYLIAYKNRFEPQHLTYATYMMGTNFIRIGAIDKALTQFHKVEEYYKKYGYEKSPMPKKSYFDTRVYLGHCYLARNDLEKAKEITNDKIPPDLPAEIRNKIIRNYSHLKGEYLIEIKEYGQATQSFQECIKRNESFNFPKLTVHLRFHLITIELLKGFLDDSVKKLEVLLKDAFKLKFNEIACEAGLLLGKCYILKAMPRKAAAIDKRIKSLLQKLDINWLYEQTQKFEQLYKQLQTIYQTNNNSMPEILMHTIKQHHEKSEYKYLVAGNSRLTTEILQVVEKIAPTDLPVLIQGKTGTGKELIARAIHQSSLRKEKQWMALNCGAVPETLLENELFGHAKGAFTDAREEKKGYIELASEGTLFLDEIADMSLAMQQKLLRVMDEKLVWRLGAEKPVPVNTRFIFASNQNIEEFVKAKKFREDLYYRINTIVITLPPLHDRKDDIPLLVKHFLSKYSLANRPSSLKPYLSSEALSLFVNYAWPGNIRELENEIKRICILYPNPVPITKEMLSEIIKNYIIADYIPITNKIKIKELKESFERNIIIKTIKKCNGNMTHSARFLGYGRTTLYEKMKQLKIVIPDMHK